LYQYQFSSQVSGKHPALRTRTSSCLDLSDKHSLIVVYDDARANYGVNYSTNVNDLTTGDLLPGRIVRIAYENELYYAMIASVVKYAGGCCLNFKQIVIIKFA
jgi:hypothetical protein